MPTLICVTEKNTLGRQFCFTDCGPSEGCNPDDDYIQLPKNKKNKEDK
ncbi:hypothetical protein JGS6364_06691 [[Clostridium] sordellii]|nr:hypothetical protein [Paeniclostridium sordellii]CEK30023.1 hypothetical protein JGS6364_06691 [[Clostridium] sordellii] [Paeniclostridium sordellii]